MRPAIERLRLVSETASAPPGVASEFPTVFVTAEADASGDDPIIDSRAWATAFSFNAFDEAVERGETNALAIAGAVAPPIACEVLTRFQRYLDRRNAWSRTPLFDQVLAEHRAIHEESTPPAKANLEHAIDTWQWVLRLAPSASFPLQLAALFHEVDRPLDAMARAGVSDADAERACAIGAMPTRRGADVEGDLLGDAAALSFFSLKSASYVDRFGATQTKRRIARTLGRISPSAWPRLRGIRLRSDVKALVDEVLG